MSNQPNRLNAVKPRDCGYIKGKDYPIYYKGLCETDPREALECARRLKALGYYEHAKHVVERYRKVKNVGPAPSANNGEAATSDAEEK